MAELLRQVKEMCDAAGAKRQDIRVLAGIRIRCELIDNRPVFRMWDGARWGKDKLSSRQVLAVLSRAPWDKVKRWKTEQIVRWQWLKQENRAG